MSKVKCKICGTEVPAEQISQYAAFGGLPSPCCEICFSVNDFTIKSVSELVAKSLLKRAEQQQSNVSL